MCSLLTRRVFRRLIANEPLVRHQRFHRRDLPILSKRNGRAHPAISQYRTFFGLFQKPQRDMREPLLDPGMEKMLELDKRIHLIARLPPAEELVLAFRHFVQSKLDRKRPIEDFHATQLLQTLKSIENRDDVMMDEAGQRPPESHLTVKDVRVLGNALVVPGQIYTEAHAELARASWKYLQTLPRETSDPSAAKEPERPSRGYLTALCSTGNTMEAREALEAVEAATVLSESNARSWNIIMAGFAREDNESELLRAMDRFHSNNQDPGRFKYRIMGIYYARKNNITETKRWFKPQALLHKTLYEKREDATEGSLVPGIDLAYQELLQFCLRNGELEWGQSLIQAVPRSNSEVSADDWTWKAIFMASAATGKSVDDIDRMIGVMARRAKEAGQPDSGPNVHTFNGLIRFAISKKDPYTAERYFGLLQKWQVQPNAETYILQVEYRLLARDLDGANTAYATLRDEEIVADEDWNIMNKLLCALIANAKTPNEAVMGLVEDLSERKRVFPADTVLALCTYHLNRDEYFEVVDLLQTYAYQFGTADRLRIRDLLVDYTLATSTDTGRSWDTYMIFHQVFDLETRRDIRNRVMSFFFSRNRPDLATHVFTRMNQHMRTDTRPDVETYTLAFEGIALNSEPEALEVIHNLLKLDTETEPCTKLYNALMLAYSSCNMPVRALDFWSRIATSPEGPSYESLHIAFRACEKAPFGYRRAATIWEKLRQADIEITRDLLANYAACLSGQGMLQESLETLERMKSVCGCDVDYFAVGSVYNASTRIEQQEQIEQWCMEKYPRLWEEVERKGREEDDFGLQQINGIDRSLKA